jgi:hypothetical protein
VSPYHLNNASQTLNEAPLKHRESPHPTPPQMQEQERQNGPKMRRAWPAQSTPCAPIPLRFPKIILCSIPNSKIIHNAFCSCHSQHTSLSSTSRRTYGIASRSMPTLWQWPFHHRQFRHPLHRTHESPTLPSKHWSSGSSQLAPRECQESEVPG